MTERWRKKLGDLDKQGPNDDVFERAKEGPRHTDAPPPGMRPSTRIATAVAAFAVFALAISVFAIPALRMQGGTAGTSSLAVFPLWPAQTDGDLQTLQAKADSGSAPWALDPAILAEKFATDVMGWDWAEVEPAISKYCDSPAQWSWPGDASSSASPYDEPCLPPVSPAENPTDIIHATPVVGAFPVVQLSHCDSDVCFGGGQLLELYQPLAQGPGHIWAVRGAISNDAVLSVAAGQIVHEGSSVSALFPAVDGSAPTLGYSTCDQQSATSDSTVSPGPGSNTRRIESQVRLTASSDCAGQEPGYVWASVASTSSPSGQASDPLAPGSSAQIDTLSAVPVTMVLPDSAELPTNPPTSGASPVMAATAWTTYTDPLGWTIDVPTDWQTRPITDAANPGAVFSNADMSMQIGLVPTHKVADDSSYPLDPTTLLTTVEGGEGGSFRGDGSEFMITVLSKDLPGPLPDSQTTTLHHMITSISFKPWSAGVTRGDWTAVGQVLPAASAQWITVQGQQYIASYGPPRALLGPAPSCPSGNGTYEIRETGVAAITCGNGTSAEWDFTTGVASSSNGTFGSPDLDSHPAELSWDGQLLVPRMIGQMSPVPTVSPTP